MSFAATPAGAVGNQDECPAGTTAIAKYEWKGGSYNAEFGGDIVTVTGDEDGGTWESTEPIDYVVVKGATDSKTVDVGGALEGTFDDTGLVNSSPDGPDISHVTFCGGEADCVPDTANNQCTPCPDGQTADGQGGCTAPQCVPTVENNQCTPCPTGQTPTGAGGCVTPTLTPVTPPEPEEPEPDPEVLPDVIVADPEAPTLVLGEVITQAPAELPRTGATTLPLLAVGLSLILFGVGAVLLGRERPALS